MTMLPSTGCTAMDTGPDRTTASAGTSTPMESKGSPEIVMRLVGLAGCQCDRRYVRREAKYTEPLGAAATPADSHEVVRPVMTPVEPLTWRMAWFQRSEISCAARGKAGGDRATGRATHVADQLLPDGTHACTAGSQRMRPHTSFTPVKLTQLPSQPIPRSRHSRSRRWRRKTPQQGSRDAHLLPGHHFPRCLRQA
jgi:hypothetical protein